MWVNSSYPLVRAHDKEIGEESAEARSKAALCHEAQLHLRQTDDLVAWSPRGKVDTETLRNTSKSNALLSTLVRPSCFSITPKSGTWNERLLVVVLHCVLMCTHCLQSRIEGYLIVVAHELCYGTYLDVIVLDGDNAHNVSCVFSVRPWTTRVGHDQAGLSLAQLQYDIISYTRPQFRLSEAYCLHQTSNSVTQCHNNSLIVYSQQHYCCQLFNKTVIIDKLQANESLPSWYSIKE